MGALAYFTAKVGGHPACTECGDDLVRSKPKAGPRGAFPRPRGQAPSSLCTAGRHATPLYARPSLQSGRVAGAGPSAVRCAWLCQCLPAVPRVHHAAVVVAYCLYLKLLHFVAMVTLGCRARGGRRPRTGLATRGGFSPAPVFPPGGRRFPSRSTAWWPNGTEPERVRSLVKRVARLSAHRPTGEASPSSGSGPPRQTRKSNRSPASRPSSSVATCA